MAAQALVRRGLAKPVEAFTVNVTGTAKVLEALRAEAEPQAVLVVTSDKCYRNDGQGTPFREDDPLGGADPYSASKAGQEHVASAFRALGLPLATVRAGNVIGGGDWAADRLVADCMRAALAGEPVQVRAPDAVRPWQHVLAPLEGYLIVLERLLGGDTGAASAWNFGPAPDDARPVGWLVERIGARWPGGLDVRPAPEGAAEGEAPMLRLDAGRARERLGWRPRWDLEAGLDATVAWYAAFRDGADMRAATLDQIAAYEGAGTV
jgi:CDP-glucose 4,6-dehydratase